MAKLYGIGVGPGEESFITLKAVKILQKVDVVVAPSSKGEGSIAYEIVKPYIKCDVVFIEFPMTYSKEDLKAKWEENVKKIKTFLDDGKDVAFITIGDPMIYSTYIYILKRIEGYEAETIPGISSYSAAASRLNIPIAEGNETFAVVPSGDILEISKALDMFDNVVLMKISRRYEEIVNLLKEKNFKGYLVIKCGHQDEEISYDLDKYIGKKIDYLSLIIAKKVK
ncbi:precorrin-2 C(20)-methyltransferase [Thermoanaerobacterium butyriciformans]|uniref:Precorrin-2/cobalt-factor-2 C20-methyltransferase n=1 Tax=Thermoanaerobacterium butyriciformans TaxID=1702242 RepID=A0ABS4NFD0_9THEO|nr:precorrin-2 C(20)-methyltransferase [Thermoanaerobacterium butyriciformans]MBP2072373.1 precorrin-2/cobalt-factor-2 C20-methyltransferase [Thermoanaerobacterium butyriciformans]TCW32075.1 precorrin-2/cobalt-factor-2 C20-methyltransferase [Thermohydrogenium kirishiense]